MNIPDENKPEEQADFVAYLDGELDDTATRAIEETLTSSTQARGEVETLSRTWDLLDLLPRADVDDRFTQLTLARLHAVDKGSNVQTANGRSDIKQAMVSFFWIAGLAVAGLVGFGATTWGIPSENEALLQDYSVIEELDKYEAIGSVEFLRLLEEERTFEEGDFPGR